MRFLKRLFCRHDLEFVRNIYGDEIIERGWKRSLWKCKTCGAVVAKDELHSA
jgi:ribosomal protein L37AE/L43A